MQTKNLNTIHPDCKWCIWEQVGTNYQKKPVYYPSSYCGIHGRLSQANTYYTFDDPDDDRVFVTETDMYEYLMMNQYIYKDSDGFIFDCPYEDLNQEQKEYLHYVFMI